MKLKEDTIYTIKEIYGDYYIIPIKLIPKNIMKLFRVLEYKYLLVSSQGDIYWSLSICPPLKKYIDELFGKDLRTAVWFRYLGDHLTTKFADCKISLFELPCEYIILGESSF